MSLLLAVGASASRADSYTINFANNASGATGISSTTNAATVIKNDGSRNYVTEKPFTVNSGNVNASGEGDLLGTATYDNVSYDYISPLTNSTRTGNVVYNNSNMATKITSNQSTHIFPSSSDDSWEVHSRIQWINDWIAIGFFNNSTAILILSFLLMFVNEILTYLIIA